MDDAAILSRKPSIENKYGKILPTLWGENIPGVKTTLATSDAVIALTFDACGSKNSGFDAKLIELLNHQHIPATLFIGATWINEHPSEFGVLSKNPLFEIENHGLTHRPCSVNGRQAYGIKGTSSAGEVFDEIELNALKIRKLTGRKPKFFRSGTAHYDDVSIQIAHELGYEVAGFAVNGDEGATSTRQQIEHKLLNAPYGSIVIFHMNHPEHETAAGIEAALPKLRRKGVRLVKLSDYKLQ